MSYNKILLLTITLILSLTACSSDEPTPNTTDGLVDGWRYHGERMKLRMQQNRFFVIPHDKDRYNELDEMTAARPELGSRFSDEAFVVTDASLIGKNDYFSYVYYPENGKEDDYMIPLPEIVVKLKEGHSEDELLDKFSKLSVKNQRSYNKVSFYCNLKSSVKVIELCEKIHKTGIVEWSEPNCYMNFHLY